MPGSCNRQLAMLTTVSTEELIPQDHPIRGIRVVVDAVLVEIDDVFDGVRGAWPGERAAGGVTEVDGVDGDVLGSAPSVRSANG